MAATLSSALRAAADPLVVDLGYGASPVTSSSWRRRLRAVRADVAVVGFEIDPDAGGRGAAVGRRTRLAFRRGGFELPAAAGPGPSGSTCCGSTTRPRCRGMGADVRATGRTGCWSRAPATNSADARQLDIGSDARPRSVTFAARLAGLRPP